MGAVNDVSRTSDCRRCGACCLGGGPALHEADLCLVTAGTIPLSDLFTIRKGEPVFDNVRNRIVAAPEEMVKIKGAGDRWACRYYDEPRAACRIYASRPLECRALNCRDTRAIQDVYETNRLGRARILGAMTELLSLVNAHDERCRYQAVSRLIAEVNADPHSGAVGELLEIISYDKYLRELFVQKRGTDEGITDFMFGAPLILTIERYGLKVEKKSDGGFRIHP